MSVSSAWAAGGDAMHWLQRIQSAAQRLNYSGTFVYMHHGGQPQTSRTTHVFENGIERERLDVLDGAALIVLRENEEIRTYSPETKTVMVEKRWSRGSFPALLSDPGDHRRAIRDSQRGASARCGS